MDGTRERGREEASGGWIERGREGTWEQGRDGNFTGDSIFTNQPFTNRPLSKVETLVLQMTIL